MQSTELKADVRTGTGKGVARKLRREGKLPAVVYGRGVAALSVQVNEREVDKVLRSKLGRNTLIQLAVGADKNFKVIIKDFQGHVLTRRLTHVDFMTVTESQKLHVRVPVKFTGKAAGLAAGGLVEVIAREVELICDLGHIPEEITVDITNLNVGQNIHLSELTLPQGVTYNKKIDQTIVTMYVPKEEEVVAAPTPEQAAAAANVPATNQKAPDAAAAGAAPAAGAGKAAAPAAAKPGAAAPAAPAPKGKK